MLITKEKIIIFFRYFWLLLAIIVIGYVVQQNLITTKEIIYQVDFSQAITRNIEGPYPIQRVSFQSQEGSLQILGEPIYIQAYVPDDFQTISLIGKVKLNGEVANIGLKLLNGDWHWQSLPDGDFDLSFALSEAAIDRNRVQIIFSFPQLASPDKVELMNLSLKFQR